MGAYESRGFTLSKAGGDNQSTLVDTAFAAPLRVTFGEVDGGLLLAGETITFAAPASGASIAPPTTVVRTTNGSGVASLPITANGTPGSYHITASAAGVPDADFGLTNIANSMHVYLPLVVR
jgi:hypothetical protein